jgi:hypothetical protein
MELFVKSATEFASVGQKARADLSQLEVKLSEMFESEMCKIDQKYQPKYFDYFLSKPSTSLLKPQISNPFKSLAAVQPAPASQPLPLQRHDTFPSASQPQSASSLLHPVKPSLKRSRSAFGVGSEDIPIGPSYSAGIFGASEAALLAEEGPVFLHTEASPPCVRPRISANLTPQSPKVSKANMAAAFTPLEPTFEFPRIATEPLEEDQFSVTSYSETDTEHKAEQDERRRKRRAKKRIPDWCRDWQYMAKLQQHVDPDAIFFSLQAFPKCDLHKIFGDKDKFVGSASSRPKKHRGSSGNWGVDGLTDLEIINYKKLMGQIPSQSAQPTQSPQPSAVFTSNYELSLNITSISSKIGNYRCFIPNSQQANQLST